MFISLGVVAGILTGSFFANHFSGNRLAIINNSSNKVMDLFHLIDDQYVDSVNIPQLVERSLPQLLKELDPHSTYIPADEVEASTQELRGSFSGIGWNDVSVIIAVIAVASVLTFGLSKPISAYQLGESYSQSMGVNVKVFRVTLILLSSLLAATVTAFAGPVSFVGIAVPHLIKSFLKTAKPLTVIPACFLGGAIFCLGCDLIARTIFAPTELSISAVTAVFGAPVVIAVMLQRKKKVV